nr:MAG TPA: hypothetical protein [Caudoviricetes sp.]
MGRKRLKPFCDNGLIGGVKKTSLDERLDELEL